MPYSDGRGRRGRGNRVVRLGGLSVALLAATLVAAPSVLALAAPAIGPPATPTPSPAATGTPTASPSPSPNPSPNATPSAPALQTVRGGPLHFSFTGSLSLGSQLTNTAFGGGPVVGPSPSPSASPLFPFQQNTSQNTSQATAGMLAEISRRTATTLTDLKVPLGFGTRGWQGGTAQAIYSTPKYSIGYGAQPLLLFGQFPLGSTLRGFSFILPSAHGQETFYEGPALGEYGEIVRLQGVLAQESLGSSYYEAGVTTGSGPATGNSQTLEFGAATGRGTFGIVGEGAFQQRSGGVDSPHGLGFQLRLDFGPSDDAFEATLRHVPDHFVAFGYGGVNGDDYVDTTWHGGTVTSMLADVNMERTGDASSGVTQQRVETFTIAGPTKIGGYTLGLQQQNTTFNGEGESLAAESSSVQGQFSTQFDAVESILGAQFQRAIQSGIPSSTRSLALELSRQFGSFGAALSLQGQSQTSASTAPIRQTSGTLSLYHQFGKTTLQLSGSITHTLSSTSNALQETPLISITRQISPAISVSTALGFTKLTDKLNPAANGHTRLFSIQLNAPFTIGNFVTTGRVDPRLPATIIGRVQVEPNQTGNSLIAGFTTLNGGGLGNVLVVLDNRYVQRTDLTGSFQFSFIPPGQHQLRIETSSLPRGVTVSTPVATLNLEGGQTGQVLFQVGNFGAIEGHVYGLDANGSKMPLENVKLRIDNGAYSQTDTTGAYGFGGLQPGKHTVAIVANTIPAFASFAPDQLKQSVSVSNGQYAILNFSAEPLGSISGKILFGPDVAKSGFVGGVPNAYVVAEPGEHAAIDENDGSFIIDDLPPGDYTLSVDPETLQDGFGAEPASVPVHLAPGARVKGTLFTVGRFEKKVVFSFVGGGVAAASAPVVRVSESRLPPRGTSDVTVDAPAGAGPVSVSAFGRHIALHYDQRRKLWSGEIAVPVGIKAGKYPIDGRVAHGTEPTATHLIVDPKMPLVIFQLDPANPPPGVNVRVHARFLVDVKPGDTIRWADGQRTVLGKPVTGRVFDFTVRISLRPLDGLLSTSQGQLPIAIP